MNNRIARQIGFAVVMLAATLLFGCGQRKVSDSDIKQIIYVDLLKLLDREGRSVKIADIRTPRKFGQEHIAGSINLPLPSMREGDPQLGSAKYIVVVGSDWNDELVPAGAKKLTALGYDNVVAFRGGVEQWKAQGGKTASIR